MFAASPLFGAVLAAAGILQLTAGAWVIHKPLFWYASLCFAKGTKTGRVFGAVLWTLGAVVCVLARGAVIVSIGAVLYALVMGVIEISSRRTVQETPAPPAILSTLSPSIASQDELIQRQRERERSR